MTAHVHPSRRRWRIVHAGAAAVLAATTVVGVSQGHAAPPPGTTYSQAYFPSADGTLLHADVLRPAGLKDTDRTPVLLEIGAYDAHEKTPGAQPPMTDQPVYELAMQHDLWNRGYTVAYVDLRGFGGSAGCFDELGPGSAEDVDAAVRWAATRPWSTGKVAVVGGSLTGGSGVIALATHPVGLAAVVAFSPIVDDYGVYFAHGVPYYTTLIDDPDYWATDTTPPGAATDDPQYQLDWAQHHAQPTCDAQVAQGNVTSDPTAAYWRARDYLAAAARSTVPVFGGQGFLEFNVATDEGLSLFPRLRDLQGLWLTQLPHEFFPTESVQRVGLPGVGDQVVRFLDHALLGASAPQDPAVVVQEAPDLRWRAEQQWPPADARTTWMPLRAGSYTDTGLNADGDVSDYTGAQVPMNDDPVNGQGAWTFTQPLPYDVHLAGRPQVEVHATGPVTARLFALLYDVAPDGSAYLVCRGASVLGDGHLRFLMQPQDWRVAAGHRLGLLVAGGDATAFPPEANTEQTVTVLGGSLGVPALGYLRTQFLAGGPGGGWAEEKRPIQVSAATIAAGSEQAPLPPREVARR